MREGKAILQANRRYTEGYSHSTYGREGVGGRDELKGELAGKKHISAYNCTLQSGIERRVVATGGYKTLKLNSRGGVAINK